MNHAKHTSLPDHRNCDWIGRIDVLQAMVRQGREGAITLLHAQNDLLIAEIEMAGTVRQETQLRQAHVKHLQSIEDQLVLRHRIGESTIDAVMLAKSETLKARIELLEVQAEGRSEN